MEEFWHNIRQGLPQIGTVRRFADLDLPTWVGGEIQDPQHGQRSSDLLGRPGRRTPARNPAHDRSGRSSPRGRTAE